MAKIFGPLHSSFGSGGLGGLTYKRTKNGSITQINMRAISKRSPGITNWRREKFPHTIQGYGNISTAFFDAWQRFGEIYQASNRLGEISTITGWNWYSKFLLQSLTAFEPGLANPPLDAVADYLPKFTLVWNGTGALLSWDAPITPGRAIQIYQERNLLQSQIRRKKGDLSHVFFSFDASPQYVTPEIGVNNDPFGWPAPVEDLYGNYWVRTVDTGGLVSPWLVFRLQFEGENFIESTASDSNWINVLFPLVNYSSEQIMKLGWPAGGLKGKILIKFDLTAFPTNEPALFAEMIFSFISGQYWQIQINKVLQNQVISEENWNRYRIGNNWATGGCNNNTLDYSLVNAKFQNFWEFSTFDITDHFNDWITGAFTNNGLIFRTPINQATIYSFSGSANTVEANRPILRAYYTLPSTLTTQTGELTYIDLNNPTTNFSTVTVCPLGWTSTAIAKPMIKWDLTGIPTGTRVLWARVTLTGVSGSYNTSPSVLLLQNIVYSEAQWNIYSTGNNWGQAGAQQNNVDRLNDPQVITSYSGTVTFDATDAVNAWLMGFVPNNGMQLRMPNQQANQYFFKTFLHADTADRPLLEIQFAQ